MSTDTPVQKDEPNASAEQQSAPVQPVSEEPVAPVQPVSEEPVAPVTETAATETDAQPSPAPETETLTQTFPRSGGKSGFRAQSRQGIQVARPGSPAADIQLRFRLFQRARLRRPTGPDSFLAYPIHADFYGTGVARAA